MSSSRLIHHRAFSPQRHNNQGTLGSKYLQSQADDVIFSLTSKGAVYTVFVAPSRPKNESVTDGPTDQPTNGRTHAHIESLRRD